MFKVNIKVNTKTTSMRNDLNYKNDLNWAPNMQFLLFYERLIYVKPALSRELKCKSLVKPIQCHHCFASGGNAKEDVPLVISLALTFNP